MDKPRIFLGSSGKQERLLKSLTGGLANVAEVLPWTIVFTPGSSTLGRLVELTREVDFAAFVFAQDDWTTAPPAGDGDATPGQASPRDNVVFEAGLFGGVLGMDRTFVLHANGAKLPSDLLGLTTIRYPDSLKPHELKTVNQNLRQAIETVWSRARIDGDWWQYSLTERSTLEPSAISLLRISRDRTGALAVKGSSWQSDGTISARYESVAAKEKPDASGLVYFWKGDRPRHPNAPRLEGSGEIDVESPERAGGYFTTRADADPQVNARTAGVYVRADPSDWAVLDSGTDDQRRQLITDRLGAWKSHAGS